jgi:Na+/H+-dicarboxylate symporter
MSHVAILLGLVAGLALGVIASATGSPALTAFAEGVAPLGALFMRALQMVVIPLVAVTVFVGVARLGDTKKLGRLGGLSLGFFWLTTIPAILIGMGLMRVGLGFAPPVTVPAPAQEVAPELPGIVDFLVNLVPRNPFEAAADGALLPMIVFTVLFAAAAGTLAEDRRARLVSLGESLSDVLIKLVHWILWTAPVGVFGLAAPVAARTGLAMLQNLGIFILTVVVALFLYMGLILLPAIRYLGGVKIGDFIRGTLGTYTIGFSTTSSVASLPMMLEEAEKNLKLSPGVSRLVLPLAASLNRPGSALFQGAAIVFLASIYGVSIPASAVAGAVLATFLVAMTVAPVPSASVMTLAPALDVVGIPLAGLGIVLGVDRVPDMFRTGTNVIGDVAAATVVDGLVGDESIGKDRSLRVSGWRRAWGDAGSLDGKVVIGPPHLTDPQRLEPDETRGVDEGELQAPQLVRLSPRRLEMRSIDAQDFERRETLEQRAKRPSRTLSRAVQKPPVRLRDHQHGGLQSLGRSREQTDCILVQPVRTHEESDEGAGVDEGIALHGCSRPYTTRSTVRLASAPASSMIPAKRIHGCSVCGRGRVRASARRTSSANEMPRIRASFLASSYMSRSSEICVRTMITQYVIVLSYATARLLLTRPGSTLDWTTLDRPHGRCHMRGVVARSSEGGRGGGERGRV